MNDKVGSDEIKRMIRKISRIVLGIGGVVRPLSCVGFASVVTVVLGGTLCRERSVVILIAVAVVIDAFYAKEKCVMIEMVLK